MSCVNSINSAADRAKALEQAQATRQEMQESEVEEKEENEPAAFPGIKLRTDKPEELTPFPNISFHTTGISVVLYKHSCNW